jgi:hypothetical protein
MKEKIKLWLLCCSQKWILLQLKTSTKRIKIALFELYRNNLSPQTTDREVAAMIFDAKYTEVLIDLGFRTLSGEDQNQASFCQAIIKKTKEIFLYERRLFIDTLQVGDNEVRKLRYRIKETNKFKAMINIKENAVICLGYPDYASFKNSTGLKWSLVLIIIT